MFNNFYNVAGIAQRNINISESNPISELHAAFHQYSFIFNPVMKLCFTNYTSSFEELYIQEIQSSFILANKIIFSKQVYI